MTPAAWTSLALLVGAYLLGAVPFGVIVGRLKGVDPRASGSGNIGATNVFRVLGPGPGLLVLLLDVLKGFLPAYVAASDAVGAPPVVVVLVAIAAILGHSYSLFLGGKGGKSVATTGGALFGLDWRVGLFAAAFLIIAFALTRYVSVASTAAAGSLPVGFLMFEWGTPRVIPFVAFGLLAFALVAYKHRANYKRLAEGTEPKFGRGPSPGAT